jgi:foldase protein PrsA
MRPLRSLLVLALPLALVLSSCQVGDDPAATVGDAEITTQRLASDVPLFRFLSGLSGAPCGSPEGNETAGAACTRFTLSNDIREEIVKEYAARHDLHVDPANVTSAIDQVSQNLGGADALDNQLKSAGLERSDLEGLARRLLLFNEVEKSVAGERLTDDQLRSSYQQSVPQFTTVDVRHILVKTKQEADAIEANVTNDNFAELAKKDSIDTQSAANGGDLGSFSEAQFRTSFDQTFVEAALALQPGEISKPVQTQFGWHIIQLVSRDVAPFESVKDQLVAQSAPAVFDAWLVERLDALGVEVNPRFGRLDQTTGEVVPVRSTATSTSTGASGATAATGGTGVGGASGATGAGAGSPSP